MSEKEDLYVFVVRPERGVEIDRAFYFLLLAIRIGTGAGTWSKGDGDEDGPSFFSSGLSSAPLLLERAGRPWFKAGCILLKNFLLVCSLRGSICA